MVKEKLETLLIVLAKQKKLSANKFKDQVNKDFPKKMSQQTFFNVLKKAVDEKIIVQEQVMNGNQKMVYYTLPSYSQRQKELIHENEKQLGFLIHFANALLNKEFKYRSEDSKNIEDETEYIAEATVELFYHAMLINGFLETLPSVFGHIEKENADMLLAGLLEMIKKIRQRHLSDDKYVEHISDVAGIHYQELRDFFIEIAPDLHGIMVMEDPHDEGVDFRHLAKHGTKLEQLFFGEQVDFYKHWEELERADQATLDNTKKGRKKGTIWKRVRIRLYLFILVVSIYPFNFLSCFYCSRKI